MISIYTIYSNPRDYPGLYVLRHWSIYPKVGPVPDTEPMAVSNDLEQCRAKVPPGCVNIGRQDGDCKAILESWI